MRRAPSALSRLLPALLPLAALLAAPASLPPAAAAETARPQLAQASVTAELQRELNALGYDAGPVDGLMGARTRSAIQGYQRDRGLVVDGQPSSALLEHVRASARAAREEQAAPAAPAAISTEVVVEIQSELRRRGYDVPAVSGRVDDATRAAIRRYQEERRLAVDGEATADTLQRLGVAAGTPAESEAEAPPPADGEAPRYATVLADDFADGDFTSNPAWRIVAGEFRIARGGLNSTVTPPQLRSAEDVGRQLLGTVLQRQLGVALPGQGSGAAAWLPAQIANAFRLTAELSARGEGPLRLDLGPFRGQNLGQGYRLAYRGDEARPLQLLLVGEGGSSVVASAAAPLRTSGRHELLWERRADGLMTVALDGETVLETRDNALTGGFEGFSLVNAGGDWSLRSLRVEVPAE